MPGHAVTDVQTDQLYSGAYVPGGASSGNPVHPRGAAHSAGESAHRRAFGGRGGRSEPCGNGLRVRGSVRPKDISQGQDACPLVERRTHSPALGFGSRLPGDARTVSTVMQLLGSLPRSATYAMSIPSDEHLSVLLNTAFWASLQQEEGRPVAVALLLQSPSSDEDLIFEHSIPLSIEAVVKLAPAIHRERRGLGIRAEGASRPSRSGAPPP